MGGVYEGGEMMTRIKTAWTISEDSDSNGCWYKVGPVTIWYPYNDPERAAEAKANAYLVAAAPRLLAACQAALELGHLGDGIIADILRADILAAKGGVSK